MQKQQLKKAAKGEPEEGIEDQFWEFLKAVFVIS